MNKFLSIKKNIMKKNNVKKKAILTGASGFVGSRLRESLLMRNYDLICISRTNKEGFVNCDLEKNTLPDNLFKDVDTVFHLAGYAHDNRQSVQTAEKYWKLNVEATLSIANISMNMGVKHFFYLSSVKAVSKHKENKTNIIIDESYEGEPEGHYGQSKKDAEDRLLKLTSNSQMRLNIIRSVLVYGKGVKGNLSLMIKGIRKGWFPELPETKNRRSMIHVDDLVRSILFLDERKIWHPHWISKPAQDVEGTVHTELQFFVE